MSVFGSFVKKLSDMQFQDRLIEFFKKMMLVGRVSKYPHRNIAVGYLIYAVMGFVLLLLPISHKVPCSLVDDLFTAVSALSTTGLATVDTSATYTIFGQCVLLLLIQIGGIGYMTLCSYLFYRITHHLLKFSSDVMRTSLTMPTGISLKTLMKNVLLFTFAFEVVGFVALYIILRCADVHMPAWNAMFLSISSFCTAGFSPFSDSLCSLRNNVALNMVVAMLAYAGGMGFIVLTDCFRKIAHRSHHITFTTKVILFVTLLLTLWGTVAVMVSTYGTYDSFGETLLVSFFHTMSATTTVGFNTIDLRAMNLFTILTFCAIMFVGASPSGTGGGVKSTSISAVYGFVKSRLRAQSQVTISGHKIPFYRVDSAITNMVLYIVVLVAGVMLLSITETFPLSDLLFEAASALGTVGLSLGITSSLSEVGKCVVIVLMFIGRIGVITFASSLLYRIKMKYNVHVDDLAV